MNLLGDQFRAETKIDAFAEMPNQQHCKYTHKYRRGHLINQLTD